MKTKIIRVCVLSLIALFTVPTLAVAALIQTGEEYSLVKGETISGNFYVVGGKVTISGDVEGDLVMAGGDILIIGNVGKDVLAVGGTLRILGDIGDDLRVAGGDVTVGGNVGSDILTGGGMVHILSDVTVEGDIIVGGGKVIIEGIVKGDVLIGGGEVDINGEVAGNVRAKVKELTIGNRAVIGGSLVYDSPKEAVIHESASIAGEVVYTNAIFFPGKDGKDFKNAFQAVGILLAFAKLLALIATALVAVFVFRRFTMEIVEQSVSRPWINLLRGFVILIVVPVAVVLLLISILGAVIGIIGAIVYLLFLLIANVYAGIIFGSWVFKIAAKRKEVEIDWKIAVGGVLLLFLISLIPFVGEIVKGLALLIAFGSISYFWYRGFWLTRRG